MTRTTRSSATPAPAAISEIDVLLRQIRCWPEGHYRTLSADMWEAHCASCGGRYALTIIELTDHGPARIACAQRCDPAHIHHVLCAIELAHDAADALKHVGKWDWQTGTPAIALQPAATTASLDAA